MGDALDRVGLAVGPVVHGVEAPLVARALVGGLADTVHDGVAQVDVPRGHVDLRAQRLRPVGELAAAHALEEVQVLRDAAVAVRALRPGLGQGPAMLAHLRDRQLVHVGPARLDELHRPLVELLEVVARVVQVLAPVEAEPADVAHDRVDVLLALLRGVGVVEAEVAAPAELAGDAEVEADRLGVADVEIAVRLRREARDDLAAEPSGLRVRRDQVTDEVGGLRDLRLAHPLNGITTPSRRAGSAGAWRRW